MIVAGYPGTGKSHLAETWDRAEELEDWEYSCILPDYRAYDSEMLSRKISPLLNCLYPENYLLDILRREQEGKVVLTACDPHLIEQLRFWYHRKVLVCYPEMDLREEYMRRYRENTRKELLRLKFDFYADWQENLRTLEALERRGYGIHLRLPGGSCLYDQQARLEAELQTDAPPVSAEMLTELEDKLKREKEALVFSLYNEDVEFVYRVKDIDNREIFQLLSRAYFLAHKEKKVTPVLSVGLPEQEDTWRPRIPLNSLGELLFTASTGRKRRDSVPDRPGRFFLFGN